MAGFQFDIPRVPGILGLLLNYLNKLPGRGGGLLGKHFGGDVPLRHLYQTTFRSFLQPYSRLDAKNPNLIPG